MLLFMAVVISLRKVEWKFLYIYISIWTMLLECKLCCGCMVVNIWYVLLPYFVLDGKFHNIAVMSSCFWKACKIHQWLTPILIWDSKLSTLNDVGYFGEMAWEVEGAPCTHTHTNKYQKNGQKKNHLFRCVNMKSDYLCCKIVGEVIFVVFEFPLAYGSSSIIK